MAKTNSAPLRGIRYEEYASLVGQGAILARKDFADAMGVSYTTAVYHVERAVNAGLLNKQYGYISKQPGWLYARPETLPRLVG